MLLRNSTDGLGKWTVQVEGVPKVSFVESAPHGLDGVARGDQGSAEGTVHCSA